MLKIGHRGATGYEPENTLLSFKKALDLDVAMIELDVQVCKSGELVVFHDNEIDRSTNGSGMLSEKTFKELRSLDAGKGEKIPTLEEAIKLVDKNAIINIEIKDNASTNLVVELIEMYIKEFGWNYNLFQVSSFNHIELLKIKQLNNNIKTGALISCLPVDYAQLIDKLDAYSINPYYECLNKELIDDAHKRGYKVFVWTVNHPEEIKRVKKLGADGIFSDFPDRIK